DEPAAALREPRVHAADEPRLELVLVLEGVFLHPSLSLGARLPLALRDLVATDMDELRGEEAQHFIEHVLQELEDLIAHAEDPLLDAPVRAYLVLLPGVPKLGIGRDRGERVARHL